mmetsp:Transcript_39554/g.88540  ORF Transcript_39554/g.88540 Transcript_39554/m.88540 type:complete len:140 (-) Transcript_39554:131-550(-)
MAHHRSFLLPLLLLASALCTLWWQLADVPSATFVAPAGVDGPGVRSSLVARQAEVKEAKKAAKKAWVGPKKGSQVRIMRPESYWFQQRGTVVNVNQKTNIKYPVTVKFDFVNYANVNTNGFALWEVDELKEGEYDPDLP